MRVREQDLRLDRAVVALRELQPQRADARAGVEDHELTARALHGHARRVAAIARGVGPGGGDRASRSPKSHRVGHRSRHAVSRAKLWKIRDRKSTRLNSSHGYISYAVFCLKKKKK